jgi:hypothetical protein
VSHFERPLAEKVIVEVEQWQFVADLGRPAEIRHLPLGQLSGLSAEARGHQRDADRAAPNVHFMARRLYRAPALVNDRAERRCFL